jgi:WGR domain-containing protein
MRARSASYYKRRRCGSVQIVRGLQMRGFVYSVGGSSKFWEIDRDGAVVTVCFGRIGTRGQTQIRQLASEAAAIAHVDRLVAEK